MPPLRRGIEETVLGRFVLVLLCFCVPMQSRTALAQRNQRPVGPKVHDSHGESVLRTPTLADALALKSINRIAASPNGAQLAIEQSGEILILSTTYPITRIKVLKGNHPTWSPNGRKLGFYADIDGKSQIEIWDLLRDVVEQITEISEGISPNSNIGGGLIVGDALSFAWSPDSRKIAFCSRPVVGYEAVGKDESPKVRVLTKDAFSQQVMEDVFRTGHIDEPDIQTKDQQQLNLSGEQPFYPSWSPDGSKIITVVEPDSEFTETLRLDTWPEHTALVVFDLRTNQVQQIATPLPINGPPRWSSEGSAIVLVSQQRDLGFPRIELYLCKEDRWLSVHAPKGMAVADVRWVGDNSLLVQAYDRFVKTVWLLEAASGKAKQIDTHQLALSWSGFDRALDGDIFFSASSATFADRVFKLPAGSDGRLQELYDANPQVSTLQLGLQRRVTWTNKAGEEVDGILILPPSYQPARHYPVLVDVYPTPAKDTFRLFPDELGQLQAARGYVVFRPSLRSPHTPAVYSRDENYNEKARGAKGIPIMLDDFTSSIKYLIQHGIADPDRIGIFGHSNGGWVVNYLITETNIAKCAVVWSGSSSVLQQEYFVTQWAHEITGGNIYDNFDDYVKMSPLFRMNKVYTPLLMIVGDRDWGWLPEMLMEFNALRQLGKDVTFVRYANEIHVFTVPEDISDFRNRVDAFFDKHLLPEQAATH